MMKEIIKSMLKRMQGEHGITEITNTKVNFGGLEVYDDVISSDQDLYFVSFLPVDDYEQYKGKRTKDEFIKGTKYFKADFDVRSEVYKQNGTILSNSALLLYKDEIENGLKKDDLLRTYNAIVCSGNGFHVYWIGKEIEIDCKTYSAAAGELFKRIKRIFKDEGLPELYCDSACTNIGRLMRLPGSINHNLNSKKKYGLDPIEVKLLYYSEEDSELLLKLKEIGEQTKAKEETKIQDAKIMISRKKRSLSIFDNSLFHAINENIDIADLVCKYTGRKLAKNGKNFISSRDGGYAGAFIPENENLVIRRGTPHFSDTYIAYSPFSFIQVHYANGDAKRTFEIAKELYPDLVKSRSGLLFDKIVKHGI